jgi:hypothetical protein
MSTHSEKMKGLLEHCVKLTKAVSEHHNKDVEKLILKILHGHEAVVERAASNGQKKAYIFVYALGADYEGVPIYNYLFPNDDMLTKLAAQDLGGVFVRIQKYFDAFDVLHKIYEIGDGIKEIELSDDQIELFRDGRLLDKKYVGAIIISWEKYL